MSSERSSLLVEDTQIHEGTSLYLTQAREVAWITDIKDAYVHIQTLTGSFQMRRERFTRRVADETIAVESQPPGCASP